jgi:hypothetical protein
MDTVAILIVICIFILFLYTIIDEYKNHKDENTKCNLTKSFCESMDNGSKSKLNEIEKGMEIIEKKKKPQKFSKTIKSCTSSFCKGFITGFVTGGPTAGLVIGGLNAMMGPIGTKLESL